MIRSRVIEWSHEVGLREQPCARGEQSPLGRRRIVHQRVGDEAEPTALPVCAATHDAVGEDDRAAAGELQRGVVRADRAHLASHGPARELVAYVEALDAAAAGELVQAGPVAVHRTAVALDEAVRPPVVVAIGEKNRRGRCGARREPLETLLRRHERIDQDPGILAPI